MKRTIALAALLAIASVAAPASAAVNVRQLNQQRGIDAGLQSGALTRREYNVLKEEQRNIVRAKLRYQASGGRYTQREKNALHAMQDAADRHINRLKDNRVRAR